MNSNLVVPAYPFKAVETLLGSKVMIGYFIPHTAALAEERPALADPFFNNFTSRIDDGILNILGINPQTALTGITITVNSHMAEAHRKLGSFKAQIEFDFQQDPTRLAEIKAALGFSTFYADVTRSKDQEGTIQFLSRFKGGMTAGLRQELVGKGIGDALIDRIIALADLMRDSDVSQEAMKGSKKDITAAGITEINDIYRTCIMIAKLVKKIPGLSALEKKKFSFTGIVKRMNLTKESTTGTPELPAEK